MSCSGLICCAFFVLYVFLTMKNLGNEIVYRLHSTRKYGNICKTSVLLYPLSYPNKKHNAYYVAAFHAGTGGVFCLPISSCRLSRCFLCSVPELAR